MSLVGVILLVAAIALLLAAEWPRLSKRAGIEPRARRTRARKRSHLRVVEDHDDDSDEFARAVERDLAKLPTIDERD